MDKLAIKNYPRIKKKNLIDKVCDTSKSDNNKKHIYYRKDAYV